jgi:hypothetical protein
VRGQLAAGVASVADREWVRPEGERGAGELTAPEGTELSGALDAPDVTAPEERPYLGESGDEGTTGGWAGSTDQV